KRRGRKTVFQGFVHGNGLKPERVCGIGSDSGRRTGRIVGSVFLLCASKWLLYGTSPGKRKISSTPATIFWIANDSYNHNAMMRIVLQRRLKRTISVSSGSRRFCLRLFTLLAVDAPTRSIP